MIYNGIVLSKLNHLKEQLRDLRSWDLGTLSEFSADSMSRCAVERALQVSIESMIDVCERILAIEKEIPQSTSAGNLRKVAEMGIIKDVERFLPLISFRNFIVHRYEHVDPEMLYTIVKQKLVDFDDFIEEISKVVLESGHGGC